MIITQSSLNPSIAQSSIARIQQNKKMGNSGTNHSDNCCALISLLDMKSHSE